MPLLANAAPRQSRVVDRVQAAQEANHRPLQRKQLLQPALAVRLGDQWHRRASLGEDTNKWTLATMLNNHRNNFRGQHRREDCVGFRAVHSQKTSTGAPEELRHQRRQA